MIEALRKDEDLLQDIENAKHDIRGFHLWWLGQSGFLIQWQGKHMLIDPYLSNSLTRKYANTDKQHIRMTELAVDPSRLDFIDVVTSSHNHTDHLDAETLIPLIGVNPNIQMIIPEANRDFVVDRIKCDLEWPIGLDDGVKIELDSGFVVHGIPAAHNELERDENGRCRFMGYVIDFGEWTIYHSGDTLWNDLVINALQNFDIDLALLPINGNRPERRVAGNLEADEAIKMAKSIGANLVVPCHFHMFTFNTVDPDAFIEIAQEQVQKYKVMRSGERISFANA